MKLKYESFNSLKGKVSLLSVTDLHRLEEEEG